MAEDSPNKHIVKHMASPVNETKDEISKLLKQARNTSYRYPDVAIKFLIRAVELLADTGDKSG